MVPFLKQHRLPWSLLSVLYTTVICPTVLCGMKVAALTKANRVKLRQFERLALAVLLCVSSTVPPDARLSAAHDNFLSPAFNIGDTCCVAQ